MKDWTTELPRIKELAKATRALHVCCGKDKYEGAIGIDKNPQSSADVRHDLDVFPYPFGENEFDAIICINAIEHLKDIIGTMKELHRISKPGGRIFISTAHFSDAGAYIDPTHLHYLSARSFDYFIEGTSLHKEYGFYSECRFKLIDRRLSLHRLFAFLEGPANRHVAFYEEVLCYFIRGRGIYLELEAIK